MDPARYERAGRIFHETADLPHEQRGGRVAALCAGDEQLRRDVESLLEAHDEAGHFIERPAVEVAAALIAADEARDTLPTRIGHYEVVRSIARGGMGEVFEALDATLGRRVALKLPRRALTVDAAAVARFEQEARSASSLNHPNIVTIYEIGETGDRRFIAMELVDGEPLAALVGRSMAAAALVRIGRQLAQALSVAHAAGIVHGDIKPENIMLRPDGYVKVLDFGTARLLSSAAGAPRDGLVFGTPRYLSPERASGAPASPASDIYALGVVLYELASGRHPLGDEQDQPAQAQPLPPALETILRRMLHVEAAARPAAGDVEAALSALETGPGAGVRRHTTHGLPAPRTAFVGRAAEIQALESLLLDEGERLVTLTGTAGTGKTRLALHLAARIEPRFVGGVSFVNLAPISDPGLVAAAIAQALGVREVVGRPLVEVLAETLRERGRSLVLIDNFEQVAPAAFVVRDLLDACPELTIVVTSRLVLHVYGEREVAVQPLPVPHHRATPDLLMGCPSVELFVSRAKVVRPDFSLTDRNAASVIEICRRLDGLPLAIELAAARAKILPPAELLARLERRFDLLGETAHDRPARQRTLRQAIDWSYYLLTEPEQRLFRRLGVFVGGCTLEAIEAVCNATEDLGVDVLRGVFALVDNSLLIPRTSGDDQSRFFMLETVREYARERLEQSGEAPATRRAHAAYILVVAEEETPEMTPAGREEWLRWCDRERDNIRAALQYLVAAGEADWGVRLGAALFPFWEQREHLTEGREAFAAVLGIPYDGQPNRARARALYHACVLADAQGDRDLALAGVREARAIFERLGDQAGVASATQTLAFQSHIRGRYAEAHELLQQAAGLWDRLGQPATADTARSNMVTAATAQGDYDLARTLCDQLLASAEQRGDRRAIASTLNQLGDLAAARGDRTLARRYHHQSLDIFRQIGDSWGVARVLTDLATVAAGEGDDASAEKALVEALHTMRALGHQRGVARRLDLLALRAGRQGRHAETVRLASAAALIRRTVGMTADPADRQEIQAALETAKRIAGDRAYAEAWAEGQSLTLDQVLARRQAATR